MRFLVSYEYPLARKSAIIRHETRTVEAPDAATANEEVADDLRKNPLIDTFVMKPATPIGG